MSTPCFRSRYWHPVSAFQVQFPAIPLRLYVDMWEAVADSVLDRRCAIGLMGSLSPVPPQFNHERVLTVRAIKVVSPRHPLAAHRAPIPMDVLVEHIQLVHADQSNVWRAGRFGLLSPRIWRLCDLAAKHHFLRAGFGFGIMPLHMVEADLASGALVEIRVVDDPPEGHAIPMSAVHLTDTPLGPAGRWFIDRLKKEDVAPRISSALESVDSIDVIPITSRSPGPSRVTNGSSLDPAPHGVLLRARHHVR